MNHRITTEMLEMIGRQAINDFKFEVQQKAKREEDIVRIMCVFSAYQYKANPTFEQMTHLVERAEKMGLTTEALHYLFCKGVIPPALDALIKELAVNWRLAGNIVESDEPKLLA